MAARSILPQSTVDFVTECLERHQYHAGGVHPCTTPEGVVVHARLAASQPRCFFSGGLASLPAVSPLSTPSIYAAVLRFELLRQVSRGSELEARLAAYQEGFPFYSLRDELNDDVLQLSRTAAILTGRYPDPYDEAPSDTLSGVGVGCEDGGCICSLILRNPEDSIAEVETDPAVQEQVLGSWLADFRRKRIACKADFLARYQLQPMG